MSVYRAAKTLLPLKGDVVETVFLNSRMQQSIVLILSTVYLFLWASLPTTLLSLLKSAGAVFSLSISNLSTFLESIRIKHFLNQPS